MSKDAVPANTLRKAWVDIPSEAEERARMPKGWTYPYDFGFLPAMGRLLRTHPRIGPAFLSLFSQIMWVPESFLNRQEREMIAGVAAAARGIALKRPS